MNILKYFLRKPKAKELNDVLYNSLFADNCEYFKNLRDVDCISWIYNGTTPTINALESWATNENIESRIRYLCLNYALKLGIKVNCKIYFGTILEMPMHGGYDIIAYYSDMSARYYNYSGSAIIYENGNKSIENDIIDANRISTEVCNIIGPWDGNRLNRPNGNIVRFSFLMSDGLYFGNGPINDLSQDQMASAILGTGANLMRSMINQSRSK